MSILQMFSNSLVLINVAFIGYSFGHNLEDYVPGEHKVSGYLSALGYSSKCVAQALVDCSEKSYCENVSSHDEEFLNLLVNMKSMINELQITLDELKTNTLSSVPDSGETYIQSSVPGSPTASQSSTNSSTYDTMPLGGSTPSLIASSIMSQIPNIIPESSSGPDSGETYIPSSVSGSPTASQSSTNSSTSHTIPLGGSTPSLIANSTLIQVPNIVPQFSVNPDIPVEVQYRPRNCADLFNRGDTSSGIRTIYPIPGVNSAARVYCDQETRGGGWTVFQRRMPIEDRENFTRNWCDYLKGFGDPATEHWLGLELIHVLTTQSRMMLHIDLEDWEGDQRYAEYSTFKVYNGSTNYLMQVAGFRGNVPNEFAYHTGSQFSTYDKDNDRDRQRHCAKRLKGGFWYNRCHRINLNGLPLEGNYNLHIAKGIVWRGWKGYRYSLKDTQMMIRPSLWKIPYSSNL